MQLTSGSTATPIPHGRERLVGIDLLRAVSIVMVLAVHWPHPDHKHLNLVDSAYLQIAARGTYGVTLFFAISGFLITRVIMVRNIDIHRMSLYDFYSRRIARIWPLLLACIAIGAVALFFGSTNSVFREAKSLPFDLAFWVSLFTFTFNWVRVVYTGLYDIGGWGFHWDVMWSLAVEEQFYLFLPLALILCRNTTRFVWFLFLVIGVCVMSRYGMARYPSFPLKFTSNACFDALALGVLTALYAPNFPKHLAPAFIFGGIFLMALGCISYDVVLAPFIQASGACMFMLGAQARDEIFGSAWALPARIGTLSYEMYLLHPLVYECLRRYITPNAGGYGLVVGWTIYIAVTAVVAEVTHGFFSEPANRWLRQRFRRTQPMQAMAAVASGSSNSP